MILPETNADQAMQIAESARMAIADLKLPHPASPVASFLTISAGVATASLGGLSTLEKLIAAADQALRVLQLDNNIAFLFFDGRY